MTESAEEPWATGLGMDEMRWIDRDIELPGRGHTSIREVHGPDGAPTLVLLHGLAATGRLNWFTALRALSERFRVIVVDHPATAAGFARTTSAWPTAPTTLPPLLTT
jgi:pimeloyl-ACP methyl ester carboxylesterase